MSNESRTEDRVPCDIILNKVQGGHMNVCRATNISLGGIRLQRLLEPTQQDSKRVRLQLSLAEGDDPIWVSARPVYEDDEFVGLKFTHISHQHFVKLRQWIQDGQQVLAAA